MKTSALILSDLTGSAFIRRKSAEGRNRALNHGFLSYAELFDGAGIAPQHSEQDAVG
jgi:hypothetical protein